jgi:hypothetical protein
MRGAGANFIANNLLRQLDLATIKYSNLRTDVDNYARAVANEGKQSDAARKARTTLINDLHHHRQQGASGQGCHRGMISKILGIPLKRALQIVANGIGHFSVSQISRAGVGAPAPHTGKAAGGLISGSGSGDTVPALLTPGEVVVPKGMVSSGAVDHLRGSLPGFAKGGMVQRFAKGGGVETGWPWTHTGMTPPKLGQAAVNWDQNFLAKFTAAMEARMTAAMKKAEAAAGGRGSQKIVADAMSWSGASPTCGAVAPCRGGADCSGSCRRSTAAWDSCAGHVGTQGCVGERSARYPAGWRSTSAQVAARRLGMWRSSAATAWQSARVGRGWAAVPPLRSVRAADVHWCPAHRF